MFEVPGLSDLNIAATLPVTLLAFGACVFLLVDLFIPKERKGVTAVLAALGMLVALVTSARQLGTQATAFNGMVVIDGFSVFLNMLVLGSGLLAVAVAHGVDRLQPPRAPLRFGGGEDLQRGQVRGLAAAQHDQE